MVQADFVLVKVRDEEELPTCLTATDDTHTQMATIPIPTKNHPNGACNPGQLLVALRLAEGISKVHHEVTLSYRRNAWSAGSRVGTPDPRRALRRSTTDSPSEPAKSCIASREIFFADIDGALWHHLAGATSIGLLGAATHRMGAQQLYGWSARPATPKQDEGKYTCVLVFGKTVKWTGPKPHMLKRNRGKGVGILLGRRNASYPHLRRGRSHGSASGHF